MVAAAGAAGIRKDEDAFRVIREGLRLGEICGGRAGLDAEPDSLGAELFHDPPGSARNLRDLLGAEAVHDLVERALDRRQSRQVVDHTIPALERLARLNGLAVGVEHGPGVQVAVRVRIDLVQLRRERVAR